MRILLVLLAICLVPSCKGKAPPRDAGATLDAATQNARRDALRALQHLEYGRHPYGPKWQRLAGSRFPAVRRALAHALGRAVRGAPTLIGLLADREPSVRQAAAFGLGCFEHRPAGGGRRALRQRLHLETNGEVVAAIVLALGRLGGYQSRLVVHRALEHILPRVRIAAGYAAGRLISHRPSRARLLIPAVRAALRGETTPSVRPALAFALARLGGSPEPSVLAGPDPMTRYFAVKAWGRSRQRDLHPLLDRLDDSDWRVRVSALEALGRLGKIGAKKLASALRSRWKVVAAARGAPGPRFLELLAGIAALGPLLPTGKDVLEEVHAAADRVGGTDDARRRAVAAVGCGAALALDRADGAPRRVTTCGGLLMPQWVRKSLAARVIKEGRGPTGQRLRLLQPLLRDVDPRVRASAVAALGALWQVPGARAALVRALRTRDAGVLGTLYDTVADRSGRDPEMERALLSTADPLRSRKDAEAMVSLARALGVVGSPRSAPVLQRLALDPVQAIVDVARRSYVRLFPADPPLPTRRPAMEGFPPPLTSVGPALRARVTTTRGTFTIRLLVEETPLTTGNFVSLARRGFYRNQRIHRVVPAFVTQMGDPRGDGFGGPGYVIPCELTPRPYRRGSVGMALAGRDTGGSQFFVAHRRTPHLDGSYTLFGEVTKGMEIVEALVEGDNLLAVTID